MPRDKPITVYLDTQDYSRFGDVIRGKADPAVEEVFRLLKDLQQRGVARFVYSMPILSELFQYSPEHEETTLAKARAIEELCRDNALLWLPRLIEGQAAAFGRSIGLPLRDVSLPCVRRKNEWFPRVAAELDNLKERLNSELDGAAAQLGPLNRAQRRSLKAQKRDGKLSQALRATAPEIADKYGIPVTSVEQAILPLFHGKCTSEEASFVLFSAIAKPSAFVNVYFKIYEGDKSLPQWLRGLGDSLERSLSEMRQKAEPFLVTDQQAQHLRSVMRESAGKLGLAVLRLIDTEEAEQGVTPEALASISSHSDAATSIPCCQVASEVFLGYIDQTVAVVRNPAKIEKSFGGDLIHALYLDCVDVWRGDRRFSELLKQRLPSRRHKVQPSLMELPEHIIEIAEAPTQA